MECDSSLLQSNGELSPEMSSSFQVKAKQCKAECRILICQNIFHYFKTRFAIRFKVDSPGTVDSVSLFMYTRFLGQQYH